MIDEKAYQGGGRGGVNNYAGGQISCSFRGVWVEVDRVDCKCIWRTNDEFVPCIIAFNARILSTGF